MAHNYGVTSSGIKSASAQICTQPALLHAIDIATPASSTTTITLYDSANSTTSGKLEIGTYVIAAGATSIVAAYNHPIVANSGIYAVLAGTATNFIVKFSLN